MNNNEKIEIGAVAKPQGIKGELKVRLFADDFAAVKDIKTVEINSIDYTVASFRHAGGEEAVLKLVGVDDRNFVETLRQKEVFALRSEINVAEGNYFVSDVIGCTLYLSSGKEMGKIRDIVSGNVDYYYVDTAEGTAIFPMLKNLLVKIDVANNEVVVNAAAFTEVVMYEN